MSWSAPRSPRGRELILSAFFSGVMAPPLSALTAQGYDLREWNRSASSSSWLTLGPRRTQNSVRRITAALQPRNALTGCPKLLGTNVLGHYYFTKLLVRLSFCPSFLDELKSSMRLTRRLSAAPYSHRLARCDWAARTHCHSFFGTAQVGSPRLRYCLRDAQGWSRARRYHQEVRHDALHVRSLQLPETSPLTHSITSYLRRVLYGQSKLGNVFLSSIFSEIYPGVIVSASIDPGAIESNLQQHMTKGFTGAIYEVLSKRLMQPVA